MGACSFSEQKVTSNHAALRSYEAVEGRIRRGGDPHHRSRPHPHRDRYLSRHPGGDERREQGLYGEGPDSGRRRQSEALIPVGSIFPFIGGQTPTGFALCNGQTLNRNQFVELFRLIGTKYGTTDTSNFRVPDLSGRFMVGVGAGYTLGDTGGSQTVALTGAQMPIHSHDVTGKAGQAGTSGVGMYASNVGGGSGWQVLSTTESGSISGLRTTSAGSGQAHENRPPYFALEYIIRTGNPAGRI